ncbi:MAG TPA: hypothetical protein PKL65_04510 [Bacteroidales bacterium]|jgi:hypothetical protein|nr:hypothetical protein [Bacteroidales bacterium]HNR41472.1 hypothetical protein [Bacteroidales bacterium]HPM17821.1 hypothetical protein [Bacteroidales bacterium]
MKKLLSVILIQVLIAGSISHAQKFTLKKGNLGFLKGEKSLLVTFDYSNMAVGKFDREDDYIAKKVEDYNKSEAGKGEKWKEAWKGDRASRYEPKFEQLFNRDAEKTGLTGTRDVTDARFEMNIHTTFTEPGFNIGITRKPAYIDLVITFRNISSGDETAVIEVRNCPGRDALGYDFDTGYRIEEAYAKLGKSLAAFIAKQR